MPLNLTTSEGEFTPYIKYNAKAGRFYVRPDGGTEDVEISNPVLAFDMANIKTGWIYSRREQARKKSGTRRMITPRQNLPVRRNSNAASRFRPSATP
jgi:hypothetical protein